MALTTRVVRVLERVPVNNEIENLVFELAALEGSAFSKGYYYTD